jgi:glutamate dehydrogenase/leucine dehydrogenase
MLTDKTIARDVQIKDVDGEVFKVVVQTVHKTEVGTVWANTAVHDQVFSRRIGGVRFVRSRFPGGGPEELTELGELAESMTWKSPLSGIPADGEKTVVYSPDGLPTPPQMAEIMAEHLEVLQEADPGVIFGPDINCNEDVMQRLADVHGAGDHVSGLLHGQGGLSIDGQGYTARGLEAALVSTAHRLDWDLSKMKAVIQGFGAVGAHTARNLRKHGVAIHAVSTVHGALIAKTDEGLDVEELFADWQRFREEGRIDDAFKKFLASPPRGARAADKNDIWTERAEIFIPAARTDVLVTSDEAAKMRSTGNTGVVDVARFVEATGVKVIVEGANHPVTDDAESYLESRGVFILPDYLVNCGGLIGCWTDWVYRGELQREGRSSGEWYHRLNESAPRYVSKIVEQNMPLVLEFTGDRPDGMRKATYELAKKRRSELSEIFNTQGIDRTADPDGREFARLCMDDLLDR